MSDATKASTTPGVAEVEGAEPCAMYVPSMDAVLNRWFRTYDEARASQQAYGGYLFPYRTQFFVTEREGVRELGLDPDDADWQRIGRDWVKPRDRDAWERLRLRRELRSRTGSGSGS